MDYAAVIPENAVVSEWFSLYIVMVSGNYDRRNRIYRVLSVVHTFFRDWKQNETTKL